MFYHFLLSFSFSLVGNSEQYFLQHRNGNLHADEYATSIVNSNTINPFSEPSYPIYLTSQGKKWTTYDEVKQNPNIAHGNPLLLNPFLYRKQGSDFIRRPYSMNYEYKFRNNMYFKGDMETSQELQENQNVINDDDDGNGSESQEQQNQIDTTKENVNTSLQRPAVQVQSAPASVIQSADAFCILCCEVNAELMGDCILQFCDDSIPNCD